MGLTLLAEVLGEADAVVEENVPETPAVETEDGGWGCTDRLGDRRGGSRASCSG